MNKLIKIIKYIFGFFAFIILSGIVSLFLWFSVLEKMIGDKHVRLIKCGSKEECYDDDALYAMYDDFSKDKNYYKYVKDINNKIVFANHNNAETFLFDNSGNIIEHYMDDLVIAPRQRLIYDEEGRLKMIISQKAAGVDQFGIRVYKY